MWRSPQEISADWQEFKVGVNSEVGEIRTAVEANSLGLQFEILHQRSPVIPPQALSHIPVLRSTLNSHTARMGVLDQVVWGLRGQVADHTPYTVPIFKAAVVQIFLLQSKLRKKIG